MRIVVLNLCVAALSAQSGRPPGSGSLDKRIVCCNAAKHHGRRIKVDMDLVEFFVPRFAHVSKGGDFEGHVWHDIWFGPEQNRTRLIIVYGQHPAGLAWEHEPPADIVWTTTHWSCRDIDGKDGRAVAADGRRWRFRTLLSGVAQYDGVSAEAAEYFDKILDSMCCGQGPF